MNRRRRTRFPGPPFPLEAWRRLEVFGRAVARGAAWAFSPGEIDGVVGLAVVEAWQRFRPGRGCAFTTYARGWVRGAVARAVRARMRAMALLSRWGSVPEPQSDQPCAETLALASQVAPALAHLSRRDRDVLLRHALLDEPLPALAAELGVDRTTVWRRLERARGRVREALERPRVKVPDPVDVLRGSG